MHYYKHSLLKLILMLKTLSLRFQISNKTSIFWMQNERPQKVVQYFSNIRGALQSATVLWNSLNHKRKGSKLQQRTMIKKTKEQLLGEFWMFRSMLHNSDHNPSFVPFDFCRRTRKSLEHLLRQIPVIPRQAFSGKYHAHIKNTYMFMCVCTRFGLHTINILQVHWS